MALQRKYKKLPTQMQRDVGGGTFQVADYFIRTVSIETDIETDTVNRTVISREPQWGKTRDDIIAEMQEEIDRIQQRLDAVTANLTATQEVLTDFEALG